MKSLAEPILKSAVVEVQFDEGIVFLDRCGKLTVALTKKMGEEFDASIPSMEFGELQSKEELLRIRYGIANFFVTHDWPETPARVELSAPEAWKEISDILEVGRKVTRCGARFWLMWSTDSKEEAQDRLRNSGLVRETDLWRDLFGDPQSSTFIAVMRKGLKWEHVRVAISAVEHKRKTHQLISDGLKEKMPDYAVLADLDYVLKKDSSPFSLGHGQLKDFIRESWEDAKQLSKKVGAALSSNGGEDDE